MTGDLLRLSGFTYGLSGSLLGLGHIVSGMTGDLLRLSRFTYGLSGSLLRLANLISGIYRNIRGRSYIVNRLCGGLSGLNCLVGGLCRSLSRLNCLVSGLCRSLSRLNCLVSGLCGSLSGLSYIVCRLSGSLSSLSSCYCNSLISRKKLAVFIGVYNIGCLTRVMLGFFNLIFGYVVRIEVGNNLSGRSILILRFLNNNELSNLIGMRLGNEACTFNNLANILFLNKVVKLLLNNDCAVNLNLRIGIGRVACRINPALDNLGSTCLLGNTSGIRTNYLLLTNDFFLINSSGFSGSALNAVNSIATCRISVRRSGRICCLISARISLRRSSVTAINDTADEATLCRRRNNRALGSAGNNLCGALCLDDAICQGKLGAYSNSRLSFNSNAAGAGKNNTLLREKGKRNTDHIGSLLYLSGRSSLCDLIAYRALNILSCRRCFGRSVRIADNGNLSVINRRNK